MLVVKLIATKRIRNNQSAHYFLLPTQQEEFFVPLLLCLLLQNLWDFNTSETIIYILQVVKISQKLFIELLTN